MPRSLGEANRDIGRVERMPHGLARCVAAEQAVVKVDAEGPVEALAFALVVLVSSYTFGGEPGKAFVPFSRLVRWYDEHPEHFDTVDRRLFHWSFKWIVSASVDYPSVPLARALEALAEMRRRYALAGLGASGVEREAYYLARHLGAADVDERYRIWVTTPRDEHSQSLAYSACEQAEYLSEQGNFEEALGVIEAVPESDCETVELADLLAIAALAELELGRTQAALRTHRRAVACLADHGERKNLARGRRFELLARGGQLGRALRGLNEDAGLLTGPESPLDELKFLIFGLRGLSAATESAAEPVSVPGVPVATLGELAAWALAEAETLAAAFDARNGTSAWGDRVRAATRVGPAPRPLDFTVIEAEAIVPVRLDEVAPVPPPALKAPAADPSALEADRLAAISDWQGAAQAYLEAARVAQDAGRLADAGAAYAEAAHCADLLGDDDGAQRAYLAAVARLVGGGASDALIVAVLVAWAPVAGRLGDISAVAAAVEAELATLAQPVEAPTDERLAGRQAREQQVQRADLHDTIARLIASAPQPGVTGREVADAITHARTAADDYAAADQIGAAAHAFWLAGRLDEDPEAAVWCLESAVEGFGLVGDTKARSAAGGELISRLQARGQDDRASQVAATIADRK